jgi:hypothetical protein
MADDLVDRKGNEDLPGSPLPGARAAATIMMRASTRTLASDLASTYDFAANLASTGTFAKDDVPGTRDLARDLAVAIGRARHLAIDLTADLDRAIARPTMTLILPGPAASPAPSPATLPGLATWPVPSPAMPTASSSSATPASAPAASSASWFSALALGAGPSAVTSASPGNCGVPSAGPKSYVANCMRLRSTSAEPTCLPWI